MKKECSGNPYYPISSGIPVELFRRHLASVKKGSQSTLTQQQPLRMRSLLFIFPYDVIGSSGICEEGRRVHSSIIHRSSVYLFLHCLIYLFFTATLFKHEAKCMNVSLLS